MPTPPTVRTGATNSGGTSQTYTTIVGSTPQLGEIVIAYIVARPTALEDPALFAMTSHSGWEELVAVNHVANELAIVAFIRRAGASDSATHQVNLGNGMRSLLSIIYYQDAGGIELPSEKAGGYVDGVHVKTFNLTSPTNILPWGQLSVPNGNMALAYAGTNNEVFGDWTKSDPDYEDGELNWNFINMVRTRFPNAGATVLKAPSASWVGGGSVDRMGFHIVLGPVAVDKSMTKRYRGIL